MKTKILNSMVVFCLLGLLPVKTVALNYTITFTGTGASSTIDSVIVQNLTKGTKVTVPAGNVLNLSDASNAVEQVSANDETIRVYPSSVAGKSMASFFTKQAGSTQLNVFSLDGRKVAGISTDLQAGDNTFELTLPKGVFVIQATGNEYAYTAKVMNQTSTQSNLGILYIGEEKPVSSGMQRTKSFSPDVTTMTYTDGDKLLYTTYSDTYVAYVHDVPTASETLNFIFSAVPKIALIWWNGSSENFGTLNTDTATISPIGTVGDLQGWSGQSIIKDGYLYVIGANAVGQQLFKCDLEKGTLISQINISSSNLFISGNYNDKIIVLWWNGSSENFGTLNTDTGTISPIGTVGDLQWWSGQSIIKDGYLYVIGGNALGQQLLYKCDLEKGTLISQINISSSDLFISGNYNDKTIVLWWDGSSENFGTLNTDTGTISPIGTVGDLQGWSGQSIIKDGYLYVIGGNALGQQLFKCDLEKGTLISQFIISSNGFFLAKN